FLLLPQVLADLRLRGVAQVAQPAEPGDQQDQQNRNPSRRARGLVAIRFLRRRYVWRNAHSPSSEVGAAPADKAVLKLSPAFPRLSTWRQSLRASRGFYGRGGALPVIATIKPSRAGNLLSQLQSNRHLRPNPKGEFSPAGES